MATRGRKSAASQEVAAVSITQAIERPDAPYDLTDEESTEWWAVINRMPADWFPRETHPLLVQYCRHTVRARRIAQIITSAEADEEFDLLRYDRLAKMAERESRILASLATKLRISQQTRYDKSRKTGTQAKPPWQS
jgi:hypothetical protein